MGGGTDWRERIEVSMCDWRRSRREAFVVLEEVVVVAERVGEGGRPSVSKEEDMVVGR